MIERSDSAESIEPTLAIDPMANAEATDPMDPIDKIEPTLPIDRIEFFDPMDSAEPSDRMEHHERWMVMVDRGGRCAPNVALPSAECCER
jgi:hypothetical protein